MRKAYVVLVAALSMAMMTAEAVAAPTQTQSRGSSSVSSASPRGSRSNPVRVGTTFPLPRSSCQAPAGSVPPKVCGRGWSLKVDYSIPNGTVGVLRADSQNRPPIAGNQFFLIKVKLIWHGRGPNDFLAISEALHVDGQSGTTYATDGYTNNCGVLPTPYFKYGLVAYPGGSYTMNICASILSTDAKGLLLDAQTGSLNNPAHTYFFTTPSEQVTR